MSRKNCAEVRCGYLNCHSNKCDCFEIVTKRTYQRKDHIARVFMRLVLSFFFRVVVECCSFEMPHTRAFVAYFERVFQPSYTKRTCERQVT